MQIPKAWTQCTNVLCLRPDNLGDVLMTVPALRALKESVPGRTITLLTSTAGARIAKYIPEIDHIITFDVPWVKHGQQQLQNMAHLLRQVTLQQFDAAIIFTTFSQNPLPTAMMCYMARIPRILGYCRENPYQLITDWMPDPEPFDTLKHEVQRQLQLVATTGAKTTHSRIAITIPPTAQKTARQKLVKLGLKLDKPWLVMHTVASEPKRMFSPTAFAAAAQKLQEEGWQIVLTGTATERVYVTRVQAALKQPAINTAGLLKTEELAATIAQARVLIANNSGPIHIASAVGTPVVVLYAQTNPQHTPWQVPNRVLYFEVPAELRSKNQLLHTLSWPAAPPITPDDIVRAVQELAERDVHATG